MPESIKMKENEVLKSPPTSDEEGGKHGETIQETRSPGIPTDTVPQVPPDGGWGWMVVLGGFLSMVFGTFPLLSFGILFSPLLMSKGIASSTIAWIFNTYGLIWSIFAIFIGPLCEEYGWRKIAIAGGITNFFSIFLSGFAVEEKALFFTFSTLGGIGGSIGFTVGNLAVSKYFLKRRGFALAMVSIGGSVSSFCGPLVGNYLLEYYSYKGAMLICAAIVLNQCVAGALFQPVKWHMKQVKEGKKHSANKVLLKDQPKSSNDKGNQNLILDVPDPTSSSDAVKCFIKDDSPVSLKQSSKINHFKKQNYLNQIKKISNLTWHNIKSLKYWRVKIIALSNSCLLLGFQNFQMWIPFIITSAGYTLEVSAWCISMAAVANLVGRISISLLSDRKWFNIRYAYMFGLLLHGISIIAFALGTNVAVLLTCVCCWGLGVGISISLHANITIHIMGLAMLPAVLGVSSFLKGIVSIIYGPIVGFTRDATSSYSYALFLLGGAEFFAFGLWLLMPLATKYDLKKVKLENQPS